MHGVLKEYYRVLKPKGTLIVVSYGLPAKRLPHLKHPDFNWEVRIEKAIKLRQVTSEEVEAEGGPEPEYHYIYICAKVYGLYQNEAEDPKIVVEEQHPVVTEDKKGSKEAGGKASQPSTVRKLGK